jgi:hypothetical protein
MASWKIATLRTHLDPNQLSKPGRSESAKSSLVRKQSPEETARDQRAHSTGVTSGPAF